MRDAGVALHEAPRKRKRRRRLQAPGAARRRGDGVALALREGLRKKVLDPLFGAEEEFDYTSTTSSPTTSSPPAGTTA